MKDDINRIDEQIKDILDTAIENKQENTKTINNTIEATNEDTKKINNIEDINDEIELLDIEDTSEIKTEKTVEKQKEEEKQVEINNSSNKKSTILIASLCIIVLVLGTLIVLLIANKNKNNREMSELNTKEKEEILEDYGNALKEIITIHFMKNNILLTYEEATQLVYFKQDISCQEHEIYDDGSVYLNDCMIDNKEVETSYGIKQNKREAPIPSGNVKIYVLKGSGLASLEEPKSGSNYITYSIDIKDNYNNLELINAKTSDYVHYMTDDDTISHIVNFKTGEKALKDVNYFSIAPIKLESEYDTRYVAVNIKKDGHDNWGFYDIIDNRETVKPQFNFTFWGCTSGPIFNVSAIDEKIAVYSASWKTINEIDANSIRYGVIDYKTGKYSVPLEYTSMWNISGYLFSTNSSNKSYIYDYSGKKYLEGKFDKVLDIISKDYILVNNKKDIELINIDGKVLYKYGEYDLKENYNSSRSDDTIIFLLKGKIDKKNEEKEIEEEKEKIEEINENEDNCIKFIYHEDSKTGNVKEGLCEELAKEE